MVTHPLLNSHRQIYLKKYIQSSTLSLCRDLYVKQTCPTSCCLSTISSSSSIKSALPDHSTQYVCLRSLASSNQRAACVQKSRILYGSRVKTANPCSTFHFDPSKSDPSWMLSSDRLVKTLFLTLFAGTAYANSASCEASLADSAPSTSDEHHSQKKAYSIYKITRMPGDGRCLFHAVVHGYCKVMGKSITDDQERIHLADKLRNGVADEFIKRREETEWFIEGDFDEYVANIRKPFVWGGEPELLMLSHLLKVPISVFIVSPENKSQIISIADYGSEYKDEHSENTITILYNGRNHYDAVDIPSSPSKL